MSHLKAVRLALSGSGFLAAAHVGAIVALHDAGISIKELAGTSGGSIVAGMAAAGMSADQMKDIALKGSFKDLLVWNPFALLHKGYCSGDALLEWLKSHLGDITFSEVFIPLTVMTTDVNSGHSYRFSAKTTPNVEVALALRCSSSVPIVFSPVPSGTALFVDGGVANNIPVDQLVQDHIPRVGVEIVSGGAENTNQIPGYLSAVINAMLASNEGARIAWAKHTGASIIPVDCNGYDFLDTDIPSGGKQELFNRGHRAMTAWIKSYHG